MGLDDIAFPDNVQELANKLVETAPEDTCYSGVYIIYDSITGEPLYVGESKNVYQRLFDHHMSLQSGSNTVREYVRDDSALDRETEGGAMWEWTEWAWVEVDGNRRTRIKVEHLVERELNPRYASQ